MISIFLNVKNDCLLTHPWSHELLKERIHIQMKLSKTHRDPPCWFWNTIKRGASTSSGALKSYQQFKSNSYLSSTYLSLWTQKNNWLWRIKSNSMNTAVYSNPSHFQLKPSQDIQSLSQVTWNISMISNTQTSSALVVNHISLKYNTSVLVFRALHHGSKI